ncbi:MAG: YciI family protein [Pseudomonadota bacterium]
MPQFALLLPQRADRYTSLTEDEFMPIMKDYIGWVEDAEAKGIFIGGHKLKEEGVTVRAPAGSVEVQDLLSTEVAEILGGLMIVEAPSMDAVIELAKSHPHLVHNDVIEIRPLDEDA